MTRADLLTGSGLDGKRRVARALYFSQVDVPTGAELYWHHIAVDTYCCDALRRFVNVPSGLHEQHKSLEQLCAFETGLRIDCVQVETVLLSIDTEADLIITGKPPALPGDSLSLTVPGIRSLHRLIRSKLKQTDASV